ncbi:MAG TPA: DUF1868 domain-containing protein [Rhizobiales bacterium]|nr:DUF1868 domain-containing protein [Hyphomicrobiales bacterium]
MRYPTNDTFATHFLETGKDGPPFYLGRRFDADGRFLFEPGNTVVSHVVPGSATQAALFRLRERLEALPFADRFAWTPVESWHMTVFQGTIEGRRSAPFWPAGMGLDAPIDETTRLLDARLANFAPAQPFAVKPVEVTPLGLVVAGATPEDERTLRALRDRLADVFGYRHPDHEDYTFHVTLAYVKQWLPAGADAIYLPALDAIGRDVAAEVPQLELAPPAFCTFRDMNLFTPVRGLG